MISVNIERIERENLKVEIVDGHVLDVRFRGAIREKNPEDWLKQFFDRISAMIGNRNVIVLDIRELEFMNATAFRVLLPWLSSLNNRPTPCKVRIRSRSSVMWQSVAVCSLKVIAENMIYSEVDP
jgi:anti-anti-sigma regulatory factor